MALNTDPTLRAELAAAMRDLTADHDRRHHMPGSDVNLNPPCPGCGHLLSEGCREDCPREQARRDEREFMSRSQAALDKLAAERGWRDPAESEESQTMENATAAALIACAAQLRKVADLVEQLLKPRVATAEPPPEPPREGWIDAPVSARRCFAPDEMIRVPREVAEQWLVPVPVGTGGDWETRTLREVIENADQSRA